MNVFSTQFITASKPKPSEAVDHQALFFEGSLIVLFALFGVLALVTIGCDPQALANSPWALW
ncbi:MAG TPA: hypothetical protein VMV91_15880 [Rhodocyclaceae bacterium]|nr:hypothetical protein [Rhodocyclaceae bacterium]